MSTAIVETKVDRTFCLLTYCELAFLLAREHHTPSLLSDVFPLPRSSDGVDDYLQAGKDMHESRLTALQEAASAYSDAIGKILGGIANARSSVVITAGTTEPVVAAAFVSPEFIIDLTILPGGTLLIGALGGVSLRETIVPSYLFRDGRESAAVLAARSDGMKLWISCEGGVIRTSNGHSFDTNPSGPNWYNTVELVVESVASFIGADSEMSNETVIPLQPGRPVQ